MGPVLKLWLFPVVWDILCCFVCLYVLMLYCSSLFWPDYCPVHPVHWSHRGSGPTDVAPEGDPGPQAHIPSRLSVLWSCATVRDVEAVWEKWKAWDGMCSTCLEWGENAKYMRSSIILHYTTKWLIDSKWPFVPVLLIYTLPVPTETCGRYSSHFLPLLIFYCCFCSSWSSLPFSVNQCFFVCLIKTPQVIITFTALTAFLMWLLFFSPSTGFFLFSSNSSDQVSPILFPLAKTHCHYCCPMKSKSFELKVDMWNVKCPDTDLFNEFYFGPCIKPQKNLKHTPVVWFNGNGWTLVIWLPVKSVSSGLRFMESIGIQSICSWIAMMLTC